MGDANAGFLNFWTVGMAAVAVVLFGIAIAFYIFCRKKGFNRKEATNDGASENEKGSPSTLIAFNID